MAITRSGFLSLALGGLVTVSGLAACGGNSTASGDEASTSDSSVKLALLVTESGLGDQGFNDLTYDGLKRAESELGIGFDYAEPKQVSDFEPILRDLSNSGEYTIIVTMSFSELDALQTVAPDFPNQAYAFIDGFSDTPNVASYSCREHEGSFLVGALAALVKQNAADYGLNSQNKYGFVGATDSAIINKFAAGYKAGIEYIDPTAVVDIRYVGGDNPFSDTATAKEVATSESNDGSDIIYHAAGGSGNGVFQAAADNNFFAIGCNSNQNTIDPDHILASMLKRVDTASYAIAKSAVDGTLELGKETVLSLADDGVGYTTEGSNIKVSDDVISEIENIKQRIIDGTIEVPDTIQ